MSLADQIAALPESLRVLATNLADALDNSGDYGCTDDAIEGMKRIAHEQAAEYLLTAYTLGQRAQESRLTALIDSLQMVPGYLKAHADNIQREFGCGDENVRVAQSAVKKALDDLAADLKR